MSLELRIHQKPRLEETFASAFITLLVHGGLFLLLGLFLTREAKKAPEPALLSINIEFSEVESDSQPYLLQDMTAVSEPQKPIEETFTEEPLLIEPQKHIEVLESPEPLPQLVEQPEIIEQSETELIDASVTSSQIALGSTPSVSPPKARNQIRPFYPVGARRRGEEGCATYDITVSEKGSVSSVTLVTSSGYSELDYAGRKALMNAHFSPAVQDGEPVQFDLQLSIEFKLIDR